MLHVRAGGGLAKLCPSQHPSLSSLSQNRRPSSHFLYPSTCSSSLSSRNSHFNTQLRLPSRRNLRNTRSITRDLVHAEVRVDGIDRATSSRSPGTEALDEGSEELGSNESSSSEERNLGSPEVDENERESEFEGKRIDTGAMSWLGQVFSRKSKEEEEEEAEEKADELIESVREAENKRLDNEADSERLAETQSERDFMQQTMRKKNLPKLQGKLRGSPWEFGRHVADSCPPSNSTKLSDERQFVKTRDVEDTTAISKDLNETQLIGCENFANGTVLQSCEDMVMEKAGTKSRNIGRRRKIIVKRNLPKREYSELHDERFMREALVEAQKAAKAGEVPVGAVLVHKNNIIARHHNRVEADCDPTAHAEMLCIRSAAAHLGGWRLMDVTLYVTLEPCPMCAGAILQARVGQLVWGGRNSLLGADGSWINLFPESASSEDYDADTIGRTSLDPEPKPKGRDYRHPFHRTIKVRRGLLATESRDLMQSFFQIRRLKTQEAEKGLTSNSTAWTRCCHMFPSILKKLKLNVMRQLFRL